MSKSIFVFLTQEALLATVANINKFSPALGLTKMNRFFLLPGSRVKEHLSENDLADVILVQDQISVADFCKNIGLLTPSYDKIYLGWHDHGNIHPDDIKDCPFYSQVREEMGEHTKGNKIYTAAVKFINEDEDAVSYAAHIFEGDPLLNALIGVYKGLTIIPLKLTEWEEMSFKEQLSLIKKTEFGQVAADRVDGIKFTKEVDDFYAQLIAIETEITTLSAAK